MIMSGVVALPIILAFIFGTAIGSFLNVLIWRLPQKKTVGGRSFCPHCKHQLHWQNLIPVLSFVFARGRCSYCNERISFRYPLIEVVTGFLFSLILFLFPITDLVSGVWVIRTAVIVAVCVIVFVVDFEHYLILDRVVYPSIVLIFALTIAYDLVAGVPSSFFLVSQTFNSLLGAVVGFIPFWLLWFISRGKWMGFGDVKFVAFMGLALGWQSMVVALFIAFTIGAIIGLALMAAGKKQFSSKIPFGTFLAFATVLSLFFGSQLWQAYWGLFSIA